MTDERRDRIESLCLEALGKAGAERRAFLDDACGDAAGLRQEVQSLIDARAEGSALLETPAWTAVAAALERGTRLGPYEIERALDRGGMGEVYRARDTRLGRTVAVKVISGAAAVDPAARERFTREARAVAALNHPHICALHDVGREGDLDFLVLEYVEGETLEQRLHGGGGKARPLKIDEALTIATEIAEALSAAHRQGIVHRDLKPANVMLTKAGVKLLDFGLAKLRRHAETPAASPFGSTPPALTAEGTIVGTLQYMAPEQLEGKPPDARTDLWALGAITYEMVTGKRAFEGTSQASLVAAILEHDPAPIASLQPLAPPALEPLVRRCLAKSPDDRPDTAHDVADELRWLREITGGVEQPRPRGDARRRAAAVGFAFAVVIASVSVTWFARSPSVPLVGVALSIAPAEEVNAGVFDNPPLAPGGSRSAVAWTPDGRAIVFVGRRAGVQQLFVRRLDSAEARPLAQTEGAYFPAVSPDGRWVAFWLGDGRVVKLPLDGGPAVEVAQLSPPRGLAWDSAGRLLVAAGLNGIWAISPDGKRTPVTTVAPNEKAHDLPSLMPGGRVVLYTARKRYFTWGDEEIVALDLTTGTRKTVLTGGTNAHYVSSGHLVFLRRGVLFALPFDAKSLVPTGAPTAVLDDVAQVVAARSTYDATGAGQFAISPTGNLAWLAGKVVPFPDALLVTVDRRGNVSPLPAPPRNYAPGVRLSPDGRSLAVSIGGPDDISVWTVDLARGTLSPVGRGGEADGPVWTPDGQRLLFSWLDGDRAALALQRADGTAPREVLATEEGGIRYPGAWMPDGRRLLVVGGLGLGLEIASVGGGRATFQPLKVAAQGTVFCPDLSPDGRWLVYVSNESGRAEVYIEPFPGPGRRTPISVGGASSCAWSKNGREIFFVGRRNTAGAPSMMAVDFDPRSGRVGAPKPLFEIAPRLSFAWTGVHSYDVSRDGQRFYVRQEIPPSALPPVKFINVIPNWLEELKARVPPAR